MNFVGIDHFVITVSDMEETCEFYDGLGADVVTYSGELVALRFCGQQINVHPKENNFEPKAQNPTPGGADFCLITDTPMDKVQAKLRKMDINIVMGPVKRNGANGPMMSVYFRDPDRNLVEIARYED